MYALENGGEEYYKKMLEAASSIKKKDIKAKQGAFYTVDIPDADVATFMDWDKPFSEQSDGVRRSLNSLYPEVRNKILAKDSGGNDPTGGLIYNRLQEYFSEGKRNDAFANKANYGAKIASEELNSINIKGIKYKDAGSRNVKGGTNNFVVFDPTNVKILKRD